VENSQKLGGGESKVKIVRVVCGGVWGGGGGGGEPITGEKFPNYNNKESRPDPWLCSGGGTIQVIRDSKE